VAIEQVSQALAEAERDLANPGSQAGFDALETTENKLRMVGSLLKLSQRPTDDALDF
jgi:hypothetical protein